ncbi:zinc ribbon domain-containing protein [Rhodocaloribacter litoris]|uniref:zinc ribbon domain-containing protein n=1 Tax=Rhodocaloribacter litoris TaxID=2558931 RepID=UPI001424572E|nr:zinc ribbon domain-containing protein [Rhodocaloribacter litoris]QXD14010.1 zinc ribbon domain-containing protein [Rhodocaloribacter litoris]GIV60803.1 MAG: hypothetical protein KatS3mg043_1892 [Rhodothermaceae bacterium]
MADKQKECPACALDVEATAEVCPYCGYEFPVQKRGVKLAAVLMVLLALGWLVIGC